MGFRLVAGFLGHLQNTTTDDSLTELHNPKFTVTTAYSRCSVAASTLEAPLTLGSWNVSGLIYSNSRLTHQPALFTSIQLNWLSCLQHHSSVAVCGPLPSNGSSITVYAMNVYGGGCKAAPFLTFASYPCHFTPRDKTPTTHRVWG